MTPPLALLLTLACTPVTEHRSTPLDVTPAATSADTGTYETLHTGHPAPEAHNVLVVLLDDVGADQLKVFGGQDDAVPTPQLQRLADEGVTYPFAYAYPTCSPSRAALVTGTHAWRNGVAQAITTPDRPGLSEEVSTLPEYLATTDVAASSAWIGKWHLTPVSKEAPFHPNQRGFDRFAGTLGSLYSKFDSEGLPTDYYRFEHITDGERTRLEGRYATSVLVDEAVAAVAELPEPWFVVVAPHAAHAPFQEPPVELVPSPHAGDDEAATYRRMIQAFDTELGRLLDTVDPTDTVVVYLGDNGVPEPVVGPVVPADRSKGGLFEGGVRVGMIARGPGVPAGVVSSQLVSIVDIAPTAAELLGAPVPTEADGVSLVPSWTAGDLTTPVRGVVQAYMADGELRRTMVRSADYKVVRTNGVDALYDLRGGAIRDGPDLLAKGALDDAAAEAYAALVPQLPPED